MRITLVQQEIIWGNKTANLATFEKIVKDSMMLLNLKNTKKNKERHKLEEDFTYQKKRNVKSQNRRKANHHGTVVSVKFGMIKKIISSIMNKKAAMWLP